MLDGGQWGTREARRPLRCRVMENSAHTAAHTGKSRVVGAVGRTMSANTSSDTRDFPFLSSGDEVIYRCCAAHLTAEGKYLDTRKTSKQNVETVLKRSIVEKKEAPRVPEALSKDIMTYLMKNRPGIAGPQEFTRDDIAKLLPMFLD